MKRSEKFNMIDYANNFFSLLEEVAKPKKQDINVLNKSRYTLLCYHCNNDTNHQDDDGCAFCEDCWEKYQEGDHELSS